jgi:hypothetical protein
VAYLNDKAAIQPVERGSAFRATLTALEPDASIFHVLAHTPEQMEDIYAVLVDDRFVLGFEIGRDDPGGSPREIERIAIADYVRGLRGIARHKFDRAMMQVRAHLRAP